MPSKRKNNRDHEPFYHIYYQEQGQQSARQKLLGYTGFCYCYCYCCCFFLSPFQFKQVKWPNTLLGASHLEHLNHSTNKAIPCYRRWEPDSGLGKCSIPKIKATSSHLSTRQPLRSSFINSPSNINRQRVESTN